jgi:hypothetical protein
MAALAGLVEEVQVRTQAILRAHQALVRQVKVTLVVYLLGQLVHLMLVLVEAARGLLV